MSGSLSWGSTLLRGLATVALFAAGIGAAVGQEPAAADRDVLPLLIKLCESCHGPGGVSTDADIPSLAGQSADRIRESMEAFYFYERHCPTTTDRHGEREGAPLNMCSIASTLSDEEVDALAAHFAAQAPGE